jgi:hypothetical protein
MDDGRQVACSFVGAGCLRLQATRRAEAPDKKRGEAPMTSPGPFTRSPFHHARIDNIISLGYLELQEFEL